MDRPALDLVIVHRQRPTAAARTVGLFVDQGVPVRVLVVDNGSPPADVAELRCAVPAGVDVLELGANTGFGPGANAGFRWFLAHDPAPWLGVAPHDAEPHAGCLSRLLDEVGARPRAGLASADVGDGVTPVVDRYFGAIPAAATVTDGWEPAGYPHGTLMVARRQCLEDVGLFDERYFAYCEEAELALRARQRGWEVGVVRGAEVRNRDVGSQAAVVDYLQLRNTLLMVREHSGRYHATIRLVIALWQLAAGLVVPARRGPYWSPRARLRAIADHLRGRYGAPPAGVLGT
ncbi:MAG TPA: glycosyltransferase family 2 protein [Acidimicrobiales bacterium]|nr:glycosyltransferase family 2 protein [Acidimicrobiales bacterium]